VERRQAGVLLKARPISFSKRIFAFPFIERAFSPLLISFLIPSASGFAKASPDKSRWAGIGRANGA
jgi:hypothetical protein